MVEETPPGGVELDGTVLAPLDLPIEHCFGIKKAVWYTLPPSNIKIAVLSLTVCASISGAPSMNWWTESPMIGQAPEDSSAFCIVASFISSTLPRRRLVREVSARSTVYTNKKATG